LNIFEQPGINRAWKSKNGGFIHSSSEIWQKNPLDPVLDFYYALPHPALTQLGCQLHQFILSYPQTRSCIRYGIPFYDRKKWVCYLNPIKEKGFEWVFLKGNQMADPHQLLLANGRKMVKGMLLTVGEKLPFEQMDQLLQEAFYCDDLATGPKAKKRKI
jgi:hypothetical protein